MPKIRGVCSVAGCGKPHRAHGYCGGHANRFLKHGDPLGGKAPNGEPMSWLVRHSAYEHEECLRWPYGRDSNGYGRVGKDQVASRLMCTLAHGEPPEPRYEAAHNCGNGHLGCVNPKHLRWKTPSENQMDRVAHGTSNRGTQHGNAALTEDVVREVRRLKPGRTAKEVAALTGVPATSVYNIANGHRWAWVASLKNNQT